MTVITNPEDTYPNPTDGFYQITFFVAQAINILIFKVKINVNAS